MKKEEHSKNPVAKRVVGLRIGNGVAIDMPWELGFRCPVCKIASHENTVFLSGAASLIMDEGLHWSEYNGFLWCERCNKDYPSALCMPDLAKASEIYLECVEEAKSVGYVDIVESEEDKQAAIKAEIQLKEMSDKACLLTELMEYFRTADPELRLTILSSLEETLGGKILDEESRGFREKMEEQT